MKTAGGWEISRRYFVMNGFDGVLTVLGVVLGAYFLDVSDPVHILGPGFGASIAIGVSGFWIAFLTEQAEQTREREKYERLIFTNLENTVISRSAKVAAIVNSFIDGFSPFLFGTIILLPFLAANANWISISTAYTMAYVLSGLLLFLLGVFLGKLSNTNLIMMGAKTTFAGLVISVLIFFTEF